VPNVLNLCSNALGQIQNTPYYATVVDPAPTDFTDPLVLLVPDIDPLQQFPPFTTWPQLHGSTLPVVGDSVTLLKDNRANWIVVAW